ncbi:MAG: hypothetical protein WC683_00725 [bacterium]
MKKTLAFSLSFLLVASPLFVGCGGGGGGTPTSQYKLFGSGITTDGSTSIGSVITDGSGNSITAFFKNDNTTDQEFVIQKLADGTMFVVVVGDGSVAGQLAGYPSMVLFGNNTITFTNWTATTVDMAIVYSDGSTETLTGVDISEIGDYAQDLSISLGMSNKAFPGFSSVNWGSVAKVSWTVVRMGVCGASIGSAVATGGAMLVLAAAGCTGAIAEGIALSLNGIDANTSWDMVTTVYTAFTDEGDCTACQATGGTVAQQASCVGASEAAAATNTEYVDENGDVEEDGGSIDFAGSCDTRSAQGTCQNYNGSANTEADVRNMCDGASGTYSGLICPFGSSVGTCTLLPGTDNETVVVLYSPIFTQSTAETVCSGMSGTWSDYYWE